MIKIKTIKTIQCGDCFITESRSGSWIMFIMFDEDGVLGILTSGNNINIDYLTNNAAAFYVGRKMPAKNLGADVKFVGKMS